ncbi:Histone core domain and Histone-fold domain-containing protein [Strongyloides ratti]|uniref:Histone core domain and Histone-fold domain-containing protein n=1 Tax=Strongyloides ratti TaxID=34506 RepID=A0A090L658_STRRB|nr:Histone core domain and Histone-fold domain-containing protein [Strongyloides ratti]CEF63613.1 Histone core domain and Histone-fold domain-containing protein [Strongyloides ratti]
MAKKLNESIRSSSGSRTIEKNNNNNNSIIQKVTNKKTMKSRKKKEIPRANIYNLVKEILQETTNDGTFKIQKNAVDLLHQAAETYLTIYFETGNKATKLRNGKVLYPRDTYLCRKIIKMDQNLEEDI